MNKLLEAMERIYNKIPKKLLDCLYLEAFAMVLVYDYSYLTRFDREPFRVPYMVGAALAGVVVVLRFLNIRNENKVGIGFACLLLAIGGGYLLIRHSFYFLVLAMLIVGALKVNEKKIIAVYLLIALTCFSVMITYYFYTNTEWKSDPIIHFGSINSTDCQSMLFFLLVAYMFYIGKDVRFIDLVVLGAIILWFWNYTRAEINMYCSLACLAISGIMKCGASLELSVGRKPREVLGYIAAASFLVCAVVMIILSVRYDPNEEKWRVLNSILHRRLEAPHRLYLLYPPSFWGSEFVQVGAGYSPGVDYWTLYAQYGYTYIDSSYPHILINHGYLVLAFILGVMTYVSYKYAKKGQLYRVLLLAIVAVDCAAEGHLKELSCNLWLVLPFAALSNAEEDRLLPIGGVKDST